MQPLTLYVLHYALKKNEHPAYAGLRDHAPSHVDLCCGMRGFKTKSLCHVTL